ncbi:SpoIIE family protein phosphatase [Streptomyces pactum]|uniref:SpoIIE family protein phosphatase n=1 Tax=Streptomyces pactum TaxID=68249 RepID=UPI0036F8D3A9
MSPSPPKSGPALPSGLPLEVFDPAPVGVAVFRGVSHVLTYLNDTYRRLFGDRPLGRPAREAFSDLVERGYLDLLDQVVRSGEPVQVTAAPVTVGDARGGAEKRHFTFSLSPVPTGAAGTGVLVVVAEVTGHVTETEYARLLAEERRRAARRYRSLVAAGAENIWMADRWGRPVADDPGREPMTGRPGERAPEGGWQAAAHPEDREALTAHWRRAVDEVPEVFEHVCRLRQSDGRYRHCLLRAAPVREGGEVLEWVGTCVDVEEQWLRDRRTELLGRAAAAVSRRREVPEAFAALSPLIVPALADECGIYLLPEGSAEATEGPLPVRRVTALARDGLPAGLPPRREEAVAADHAITRAVRERRPVQAVFPPGEVPEDFAPPGTRSWLNRARAHSGVLLPVLVDGTVAAVLAAFTCGDRDPVPPADRDLMRDLIEQAHAPLSRAMQLRRTQQVARALQHSLLTEPPDVPELRIAVRYLPSPAAAEVGGDWYDAFVLPDGATTLVIGDVAGHDLAAAVTMSQMRNMLRALAMDRVEPPGDILRRLDVGAQLLRPEQATTTCVLARVEGPRGGPWQLNYSVAGHPPPLLVTADGTAVFLDDAQDVLLGGLLPEAERIDAIRPLPPDATVLLYTDGLVERPGEDITRGLERLRALAGTLAGEPLEAFCDRLLADSPVTGRDDIALIALRLPPEPG